MIRIYKTLIYLSLVIAFISCNKYEIISREDGIVTVDKGYLLAGQKTNLTKIGRKVETDTTSGNIISITKYRHKMGCFEPIKIRERKRLYQNGNRTKGRVKFNQLKKNQTRDCD
ncbi:MAG: hypothetical protein ACI8ZM_003628 [Crocinitomix sp.]|jgi:hypothetical protein